MYPNSLETTHRLASIKAESYLSEAEKLHMLKACHSESHRSWLMQRACHSLYAIGRILIRTGQRLQRYEGAPAPVRNVQAF